MSWWRPRSRWPEVQGQHPTIWRATRWWPLDHWGPMIVCIGRISTPNMLCDSVPNVGYSIGYRLCIHDSLPFKTGTPFPKPTSLKPCTQTDIHMWRSGMGGVGDMSDWNVTWWIKYTCRTIQISTSNTFKSKEWTCVLQARCMQINSDMRIILCFATIHAHAKALLHVHWSTSSALP